MKLQLVLAGAALGLVSCAPISEEACRAGNWGAIGLEDGKNGRPMSIIDKYAETCAEFGSVPDRTEYAQGRAAGLVFYCTPENAYSVGRAGKSLSNVCEPSVQASMRPAYNHGRSYYKITEEIEDIEDRLDDLRDRLRALPTPLSPEDAVTASALRSKRADLKHDIFMLELQMDRYDSWP